MKKLLLSAMIIAAAMTSCSKKTTDTVDENDGRVEIKFSSNLNSGDIQPGSKAALEPNSTVTGLVFRRGDITAGDAAGPVGADAPIILGDRDANGDITFANKQYYLPGTMNPWFCSYYPQGSMANNVVTWEIDGKTDILIAPSVWGSGVEATPVDMTMNYEHQMAWIEVFIQAEAGKQAGVEARWGKVVGFNLRNTATSLIADYTGFLDNNNMVDGDERPTLTTGVVADLPLWGSSDWSAINPSYIPQTVSRDPTGQGLFAPTTNQTIELSVMTQGEGLAEPIVTTNLVVAMDTPFSAGFKHKVVLTFMDTPTTPEIKVKTTIEAWKTGGTGNGNLN